MRTKLARCGTAVLSATALGTVLPAFAQTTQETPPATASQADEGGINDIVVTAQRFSQRLQDVPAAVSALTGDALAKEGLTRITDLTARVPSLNVSRNLGVTNIYIRGIGNTFLNVGGDQSVAFHENGVYIGRPRAQSIAFLDVERVEVLRGPQGTLYGRNATGGSINIITRMPTIETAANLQLTAGNYGLVRFEGGIGGAIAGDKVSARVAMMATRRGGFGENIITGNPIDDLREFGVRAMVKIEPADTFALLLSGEYYYQNDNGNPWHYVGPGRPDVVPLGTRLGGVVPQDPRDIASNRDSARESRVSGLAAIATWTPLPGLAVKSTTAYRDSFSDSTSDADGSSPALLRLDHTESARQFSQELQLTYQDDRVEAVGGLYYFDERVSGSTLVRLLFVNPFAFAGSGPGVGNTKAYAAYGQLGVKLTDALTVTGALRYSHEKRDAVGSSGGVPVPFREASWNSLTPKVIVDYQVSDRIKLYASAGKGFKSGTFLIGNANPVVNPENVWAYEAGIKSEFLDRRLQVNLAAFWYDYTDLQVSRVVGNTTLTENAASARIRGVEAEISARPMERNTFSVNGAYLDARFQDYRTPDAVRPELGALNLAGKHLPYSPKWTFNIRDEQRFPVGADQEISVSADYTYTSRLYHDPFNLMSRGSDAYGIFNARVAYEVGGGDWSIALWGRNLTDKLVRTTTIASVAAVGFPLIGSLNEPPSYGIDLAVRF